MKNERAVVHHTIFYMFEIVIVGGGLFVLLALNLPFLKQLFVLSLILAGYVILGIIHHKLIRDVKLKIVLEYVLISLLIFAAFIFVNVNKL